jgi:hypothetical protein
MRGNTNITLMVMPIKKQPGSKIILLVSDFIDYIPPREQVWQKTGPVFFLGGSICFLFFKYFFLVS